MTEKTRSQQAQKESLTQRPDRSSQENEKFAEIVEVVSSLP